MRKIEHQIHEDMPFGTSSAASDKKLYGERVWLYNGPQLIKEMRVNRDVVDLAKGMLSFGVGLMLGGVLLWPRRREGEYGKGLTKLVGGSLTLAGGALVALGVYDWMDYGSKLGVTRELMVIRGLREEQDRPLTPRKGIYK